MKKYLRVVIDTKEADVNLSLISTDESDNIVLSLPSCPPVVVDRESLLKAVEEVKKFNESK